MPFTIAGVLFDEEKFPQEMQVFLKEEKFDSSTLSSQLATAFPDGTMHLRDLRSKNTIYSSSENSRILEEGELTPAELMAALGKLDHLKMLLMDEGAIKNLSANNYGVVRLAIENGHLEVVKHLLTYEAVQQNIATQDNSALRFAAMNGHLEVVKHLLTYEAVQQNIATQDNSALHLAAMNGHLEVVKHLLTYEAVQQNIATQDNSALRLAAKNGHFEVVKHLLTYEAVQQNIATQDNSALRLAAMNGHLEVVKHLLTYTSVFSYAEMHEYEYSRFTHPFINEKLAALHNEKSSLEELSPNAIFDLNENEAKLCFYIARNLIRRNSPELLDELRFLLEIPAVKNLAHREVNAGPPNELLRLAATLNNQEAADILLTIPAVRELAEQDNFYASETAGQFDLRALAQDTESSMHALSTSEQKRLKAATDRYQPLMQQAGIDNIFADFHKTLADRYEENPAKIQVKGQELILPLSWPEFEKLELKGEDHEKALEAYYQNDNHSAYRYLSKPNPWMHAHASYVYVNPDNTQERWSTFEEYKPLISMLCLAAQDEEAKPTEGYTLETRFDNFVKDLALIGRAHNWDKSRPRADDPSETEEYDDLEGDRPSCFSGVKRRLFQSVRGHPLLNILTTEKIKQELSEFATNFVKAQLNEKNRDSLAKQYENLIDSGKAAPDLEAVLAIPKEKKEEFLQILCTKYSDQMDSSFKKYFNSIFEIAKFKGSETANAMIVGGGLDWSTIFEPKPQTTPHSLVTSSIGFFAVSPSIKTLDSDPDVQKEQEHKKLE